MLEKSFSILFYLKKPKGYTTGVVPIYLRVTVNGIAKEITTKQECDPTRWNIQSHRVKGTNEQTKSINALIDLLERKVHNARLKLLDANKEVSAQAIKDVLIGKVERPIMLLEEFEKHNAQIEKLRDIEFATGTIKRYKTTIDHTRAFIQWKYNTNDIALNALSFSFISDFEFYLKTEKKCCHNTVMKYLGNMRKIINYCVKCGVLQKDPFFGFSMAKKEVVRDYLHQNEIDALVNKKFEIERIGQVRDIFVFCCYTGLAFIDVFQLTPNNIVKGIDNNDWIFSTRQKTDVPTRIPLLHQAKAILEKYKDNPKCLNEGKVLPVLSNQKMNAYLKEVADLCGITKTLTFHIARHTFATTVTLSNGVPIETVSKMLGHSSIKMTQHYAKIIDRKLSDDMQMLQTKLLKA